MRSGQLARTRIMCQGFFRLFFLNLLLVSAHAQTLTVLHTFTGTQDGGIPLETLNTDAAGNLYGTTAFGGTGSCSNDQGVAGCGVIFRLKNHNGSWLFAPLYSFQGGGDGAYPMSAMVIGPNGTLYGTTEVGGDSGGSSCFVENTPGCGIVFNSGPTATPPVTALLKFRESVLYRFSGPGEAYPLSSVVFDAEGNLYGTTSDFPGTIFELSPVGGGNWTQNTIYEFAGGTDGLSPFDGLVWDTAGNLYGTTTHGGGSGACSRGCGTVYRLSPSGSVWTETVIYRFQGAADGGRPNAGVAIDASGNLYGNTTIGGSGAGTVYKLSPSGGGWNFQVLYSPPSGFATARVTLDSAGNLYETQGPVVHSDSASSSNSHHQAALGRTPTSTSSPVMTDVHTAASSSIPAATCLELLALVQAPAVAASVAAPSGRLRVRKPGDSRRAPALAIFDSWGLDGAFSIAK